MIALIKEEGGNASSRGFSIISDKLGARDILSPVFLEIISIRAEVFFELLVRNLGFAIGL